MSSHALSVSVVIPNYNGKLLLKQHLPDVIKHSGTSEIIVVDDASSDDSVEFLKQYYPEIKVIIHQENLRFSAACNTGVSHAHGDIVVLLNNDVSPQKGYLDVLLSHFDDNKVFAVGCGEINTADSNLVESGKGCGGFARGLLVHWPCDSQTFGNSLWASAGSGAFRKRIWNKIGGLDTLFTPAYEEDRDICYRALKSGYRVFFEPKSIVAHIHETSNTKSLGKPLMEVASYKNQLLLFWKNCTSFRLWLWHLLWLPYHLIFTTVRSKGNFLKGFFWALSQLGQLRVRRKSTKQLFIYSDEHVISSLVR